MTKTARMLVTAALMVAPLPALAQQALSAEQEAFRAHIAYLASDELRGREAGTPDYDRAAEYVVKQMQAVGLKPAAKGGWLQPVPLLSAKLAEPPVMALTVGGKTVPLAFGTDFTATRATPGPAQVNADAGVVFAGYGVVDPASGIDDYKGLDVRGKIVALVSAAPHGLNSEVSAHLSHPIVRAREAAAHGAVGIVLIQTTRSRTPFATAAQLWEVTAMIWVGPDGKPRDGGAPALGLLSDIGASKLFEGAPFSYADVVAADQAGQKLPSGPLAATMRISQRYAVAPAKSANVVGVLRGSDPKLRDEYVVLSAHLDHIGVTAPVNGDSINNGAMDNASGIASMLEAAKLLAKGKRPKRSILFVAVTAEEKGLVGSDYYAAFPTVPKASLVANVNLDMPILTYRFEDLVAFGADRSDVGPHVAAAAKSLGFVLSPDPTPEQASFVRTDHYSFVKQGVPSVTLSPGAKGPGLAARAAFRKNYHQPSDQIDQPFDWTAAANFVAVNAALARGIADAPERPRWVKGDYFGTLFKGPVAK